MQEADAQTILDILCEIYPNHPWAVTVKGGVVFIQHLAFDGPYGMCVKFKDIVHDAAVMKREIIMKAGEWLERAGLARGIGQDEDILRVEGVPEKYQPVKEKPVLPVVTATDSEGMPLRTDPHRSMEASGASV